MSRKHASDKTEDLSVFGRLAAARGERGDGTVFGALAQLRESVAPAAQRGRTRAMQAAAPLADRAREVATPLAERAKDATAPYAGRARDAADAAREAAAPYAGRAREA
ncbi:MAG TPA: hypothetical protein PK132_12965, partial [Dermatophilaceae bacterium]|nr:hypothetical protein [Dermatophilaceae bacterium]